MRGFITRGALLVSIALGVACGKAGVDLEAIPKPGLSVSPGALSFPPTYVGETAELELVISAESPWSKGVALLVDGPFTIDRVRLPPGEQTVKVTFAPSEHGRVDGMLYVHAGDYLGGRVPLAGNGRDPSQCVSENPCEVLTMNLESGLCEAARRPDGTGCETNCTLEGTCQAGTCVGTARSCEDGNACTLDYCDESVGCRTAPQLEGAQCGEGTCDAMPRCSGGVCQVAPAPDSYPCMTDPMEGDPTHGRCVAQRCEPL